MDLGAFFSSFIGTKACAVPNPTRGQGLGISWTQDKEKRLESSVLLQRGLFGKRSQAPQDHRTPIFQPALWELTPCAVGPPPPFCPSICWSSTGSAGRQEPGRQVGGATTSSSGRNPQVSAMRSTNNQRPRVARCNWNNKCDARKLPTSCCYAIVCLPRMHRSAWEDRNRQMRLVSA